MINKFNYLSGICNVATNISVLPADATGIKMALGCTGALKLIEVSLVG
jgi:hypothetical protein